MEYDSKKTLTENESLLTEQGEPIPMPSTQLPSDYTGDYGTQTQTYTPQIYRQKVADDKSKEIGKNTQYPINKEESDKFRQWFNKVFPYVAKNPCGDGQKLDLTGDFNNKWVKCAADFDGYGKRAYTIFQENKGQVLKVYKNVIDREKQLGIPIGFTEDGWKEYQNFKSKRDKECKKIKFEFESKLDKYKQEMSKNGELYVPEGFKLEEQKIQRYCVGEVEDLKLSEYHPNFPFGINPTNLLLYQTLNIMIGDRYPLKFSSESCRQEKFYKSKGFDSIESCMAESENQAKLYSEEIKKLRLEYGFVSPKKETPESLFDQYRLMFELAGMVLVTLFSGILAGATEGLLSPALFASASRLKVVYELVFSAGLFGSLAKYDYSTGNTHNAAMNIVFIFLPLIHKLPGISNFLGKFSSNEIIKSSEMISKLIAANPINSAKDLSILLSKLDPTTREIFIKALKIDPSIMGRAIESMGQKAVSKLGAQEAGKIALETAKKLGVKTSYRTGGKFLTNSNFVNKLQEFAAMLSVDLPIIHLLGEQIYKILDGDKNDLSVQLQNIAEYYKNTYNTPEEIKNAIIQDVKKIESGDRQTIEKIKTAAKKGFTQALSNNNSTDTQNEIPYDDLINIKIEN